MNKTTLDDIAAKLPQVEFKTKKKRNEYYNQNMQSIRGGRQFRLKTSPERNNAHGDIRLTLIEYGNRIGEEITIASRCAVSTDSESFTKALKSLERKAKCKLYYVLLISTDGEYL